MYNGFGLYKHFKNKYYLVLGTCKNADNFKKEKVIYISLYKGDHPKYTLWERDITLFNSDKLLENENGTFSYYERYMKLNLKEIFLYIFGFKDRIFLRKKEL